MSFYQNLNQKQRPAFIIISAILLFVIIIFIATYIMRIGKTEVIIQYAPLDSKITLNGTMIKNKTTKWLEPGNYEVIVRDSGIGMSAEFQQRMYEPFEREEKSTTSGVPGNGLGLSIIKRLVEIGGGSIEVKSEPGQGTEFKINLEFRHQTTSLMAGSGSRKSGRRNRAAAPTFDMSTFAGKRFLIVEDSRMNRAILSEFLKRSGGESDTAENGKIAVDMIDEKPAGYYACILMDAQMPTMNGYEAAKAIRRMEDSDKSGIPIICISANAFKEDREAAKAAGMDDYLEKPIDVNKLIEKMLKLIG